MKAKNVLLPILIGLLAITALTNCAHLASQPLGVNVPNINYCFRNIDDSATCHYSNYGDSYELSQTDYEYLLRTNEIVTLHLDDVASTESFIQRVCLRIDCSMDKKTRRRILNTLAKYKEQHGIDEVGVVLD